MSTFLRDSKIGVCLRPIEAKDAKICAKWINDRSEEHTSELQSH